MHSLSQVLVAQACNLSYEAGRDDEDCGSKPAQANRLQGPIMKIYNKKRAGGVTHGIALEFKSWYHKINEKINKCIQKRELKIFYFHRIFCAGFFVLVKVTN
jgi:hypothetical protein